MSRSLRFLGRFASRGQYKYPLSHSPPNFSFLSQYKMSEPPRRRRLCRGLRRPNTPPVASPALSLAGPQSPQDTLPLPSALQRHQPPPGVSVGLFHVLCLRCAVRAGTDPSSSCLFDDPDSVKCLYCRGQKSLCDPVSSFFFSSLVSSL